ncbi:MAG: site-specific integrase [Lewinellaceae bacterium]|nr:site-specific integrase [Lewinellaceae bacterium]
MRFKNICWKYQPRQDGTCSIKIYVNISGKQKYYPVEGIFVLPTEFDQKNGVVRKKHPLSKIYNAKIRGFRNKIEEHFLSGGTFNNFIDGSTVKHSLIEYLERFIREAKSGMHGLSGGTIKNYQSALTRLKQFASESPGSDIYFDGINKAWESKYTEFMCSNFGVKLDTVGNHLKCIKRLMTVSYEIGLHSNTDYHSLSTYKNRPTNKTYLNESEIQAIASLCLSSQVHLEKERDRFIIAYYFLLRFSDVQRLSRKNIIEDDGKKYFRVVAKKTKTEAIIPVKPTALDLLEKYDYNFSWGTNQQANRFLKVIAAMAGINDLVEADSSVMKSQLVTTHTARRSAATNLCLQGASLKTIADLGGWKNIQALQIYLRASGLESAKIAGDLDFFK